MDNILWAIICRALFMAYRLGQYSLILSKIKILKMYPIQRSSSTYRPEIIGYGP